MGEVGRDVTKAEREGVETQLSQHLDPVNGTRRLNIKHLKLLKRQKVELMWISWITLKHNCTTVTVSIKEGGLCIFSVYTEILMVMASLKNVYMFRGALHRHAETLALVFMSQPPAAYSDCLNIKILGEPNHGCGSAKVLQGHTRKV